MDKGFHTGVILADLQKAFDTLDHTVLLQNMEYMGFKSARSQGVKESAIKWFQLLQNNLRKTKSLKTNNQKCKKKQVQTNKRTLIL